MSVVISPSIRTANSLVNRAEAHPILLFATLALLILILFIASIAIGYAPLDVPTALGDWLAGRKSLPALVVSELRFPRAALGAMVGFTLGLAGAAMQGLLRNPLAEPGVIGVSGAASLGAVIAFYSGLSSAFALATPACGIAGALIAMLIVQRLSRLSTGTTTLILVGVALNSFAAALTSLALNLSPNPYAALEIVFWLMGSLADRTLTHIWLALPFMAAGWILILSSARSLDGLTLGEDTARTLGVDLVGLRRRLIIGTALSVGSAVAISGAIGFIGLVVPHLLRPFVGHRPGRLLLASGLGGGALLLAADIVVRIVPTRPELKLGVVTALIGAPFLVWLIFALRRQAGSRKA